MGARNIYNTGIVLRVKSSYIREGVETMKRPLIIIISVIAVFLLLGTAITSMFGRGGASPTTVFDANRSSGYGFGGGGGGAPIEAPAATQAPAAAEAPLLPEDMGRSSISSDLGPAAQERLVIQNADLAIVVKDPKARMAEISSLANEFGGFVVSSNLYQSYTPVGKEVPEANIVIRVPSDKLDEALDR